VIQVHAEIALGTENYPLSVETDHTLIRGASLIVYVRQLDHLLAVYT